MINLPVVDFRSQPREMPLQKRVTAADWRYQTHVKKYLIFSRVLLRLFSGLEILV